MPRSRERGEKGSLCGENGETAVFVLCDQRHRGGQDMRHRLKLIGGVVVCVVIAAAVGILERCGACGDDGPARESGSSTDHGNGADRVDVDGDRGSLVGKSDGHQLAVATL